MKTSKLFSWILYAIGVAIIVIAFVVLGKDKIADDVLVLDTVVSVIVYSLFFIDVLVPWVDFGDPSQRRVGNLGIRWFFTIIYDIAAIGFMVYCLMYQQPEPVSFKVQIIVQAVLLFLLLMGLMFAKGSEEKVAEVHAEEREKLDNRDYVKRVLSQLNNEATLANGLPDDVRKQISDLADDARFMAPNNADEAADLDNQIVSASESIRVALADYEMNKDDIARNIALCQNLLQRRKGLLS